MDHQTAASATEKRSAGQDLGADRRRRSIAGQFGRSLKFGEEIEQEEYGTKGCFGGEEFSEAESIRAQVVFQFGNPVFHVGAPVVVAPDLLGSIDATGDEHTEGVAGHVDQLAAHAVA